MIGDYTEEDFCPVCEEFWMGDYPNHPWVLEYLCQKCGYYQVSTDYTAMLFDDF